MKQFLETLKANIQQHPPNYGDGESVQVYINILEYVHSSEGEEKAEILFLSTYRSR